MESIQKEHIISGIIGGVATLALGALAMKIIPKCCYTAKDCTSKMRVQSITSTRIPNPIGPYKAGKTISCCGQEILISSGQIGVNPETSELVGDEAAQQADQAIINLKALAEDNGFSLNHCVKTTVFITDFADFAAVNDVYKNHFTDDFPARSCVAVAQLPKNAKFEIEAMFLKV